MLLLDDTWTTGARVQSLSHALKDAGANKVAAVVLGRWVNPSWPDSQALISHLRRSTTFDLSRCVVGRPA
ncbi:hypothetical protein G1H11_11090 [Phytoactinopolyspora alkaliphila]|uniref:Phosphoribosyltransferase domain-containing protein n=1 Tax=Phytoactinopolyspora alkaliphila TaxID=1783498 RepID=A0A6N9YLF4_9ACTN|nr:hypothetical protein [Phytoactinopolyspora alkaliphila]